MRDSWAFHGLAISGAMIAAWIITGQDSVPWTYVVLNTFLGLREVAQMTQGVGSTGDLISGIVLPLPILYFSIKL